MGSFSCKNCSLEFDAEDTSQCPRCSSAKVYSLKRGKVEEKKEPKKFVYGSVPVTDTKESWIKFHNTGDVQRCPVCEGIEFEFDWKRREKTCSKCGEILPLRRMR